MANYFATYHQISLALDPFPYAGGTTTCDALWMGVPVITLRGATATARAGVSLLHAVGHPEWIADSPEQYAEIAATLAGDAGRLSDLRRDLRRQMLASPLCNAGAFARQMEAAFLAMWEHACPLTPPADPDRRSAPQRGQRMLTVRCNSR